MEARRFPILPSRCPCIAYNLLVGYHGELKVTLLVIQGLYRDDTTPKKVKGYLLYF